MNNRWQLQIVGMSLFTVVAGCSQGIEAPAETVGVSDEQLYGGGSLGNLWTGSIPVCFTQTGSSFDTLRQQTRDIVTDTWARVAPLKLTGWGTCTATNPAKTIVVSFAADTNGATNILGWSASGATTVQLISNDGAQHFRYEAIHEFGHALGFAHDQERPDNWDANGNPIFCNQVQVGRKAEPGGIAFSGADNNSVMSYCAGFATALSARDVVGLRAAYSSNAVTTCQELSDLYGIKASATFGFAPTSVQNTWRSMSCSSAPSSADACQKASDLYGIEANVTFGFAPSSVQTWWASNGCNTAPRDSLGLCQRASETFGIVAFETFGTAPSSVQSWWTNSGCNTVPRNQDTCQHLSDLYGIKAGVTFGWAPTDVQTRWSNMACQTAPTQSSVCQQLSDLYGLSPSEPAGAAPTAAQNVFSSNGCTTSPRSTNTCQRASDLYAIKANASFGFAPSEVQSWWSSHGCNAQPTFADMCKVVSDRYGVVANVTFGAAPAAARTWWTAQGCGSAPTDAAPTPG